MFRIVMALAGLFCTAALAHAQHCRGVTVGGYSAPAYYQPTYYPQTYYPQTYQNTYVGVPVAVYAVPGNPTVALNVYPSQFAVVQPVPVSVTVNLNGQKAEAVVEPKK